MKAGVLLRFVAASLLSRQSPAHASPHAPSHDEEADSGKKDVTRPHSTANSARETPDSDSGGDFTHTAPTLCPVCKKPFAAPRQGASENRDGAP